MSVQKDPNGTPAHVTDDNHALVAARTEALSEAEALLGWGFLVHGGILTLTNASTDNGLLYIKNSSEDATYIITKMELHLGNSTSGTGDGQVKMYRNPTTGTLISDASDATISNRNTGKSQSIAGNFGLFYKAVAAAETITDGGTYDEYPVATPTGTLLLESESIVLEPNGAIAVSYTTQTSNSSQAVSVSVEIHKLTLGV